MIRHHATFAILGLCLALSADGAQAQDKNPGATPALRDPGWRKRHEEYVEIAKKGEVDVLFLGDSITYGWRWNGKTVWEKHFAPLKAANFGIAGDQTQHVLWRIQNGELDGITPRVVVLMIGTNNVRDQTAEQIAGGVTAIVKTIHEKSPKSRVLLLAIFPRGARPDTPEREKIAAVNRSIARLGDGKSVRFLDIGAVFTQADGTLTRDIMPDYLHLSVKGYEMWADAIAPTLREMLRSKVK